MAIDMRAPYRGERIDLHVADESGAGYTWLSFHPACRVPEIPMLPIAPGIAARSSWSLRAKSVRSAPRATLFRARVYRRAGSWSAELAVGLTTIEYHPTRRKVFRLEVTTPAGETVAAFAPPRAGAAGPAGWQPLRVPWQADAAPFTTFEEDARRKLEYEIFHEFLDRAMGADAGIEHIGPAVRGRKSNQAIDALLARLDGCIESDPGDYFAHWCRTRLLREANRLDAAARAFDTAARQFPYDTSAVRTAQRRTLLLALGRFEEAARDTTGLEDLLGEWRREQARLERDVGLPRVAFETTKGRVVVELFSKAAPRAAAHVLGLVERGRCTGAVFDEVTGASHATARFQPGDGDVPATPAGRRTWRGYVSLDPERRLLFATGHRFGPAVGRVVEGMAYVDALEAGDKIVAASVVRR